MGLTWFRVEDGRPWPALVCDVCGRRIEQDKHQGLARLLPDGKVQLVHKTYGGRACDPDDLTEEGGWMELNEFFGYVACAAGLTPKSWPSRRDLQYLPPGKEEDTCRGRKEG